MMLDSAAVESQAHGQRTLECTLRRDSTRRWRKETDKWAGLFQLKLDGDPKSDEGVVIDELLDSDAKARPSPDWANLCCVRLGASLLSG